VHDERDLRRQAGRPAGIVHRETIKEVSMAEINWLKDVDAALAQAKSTQKPVLLDFSAAPM